MNVKKSWTVNGDFWGIIGTKLFSTSDDILELKIINASEKEKDKYNKEKEKDQENKTLRFQRYVKAKVSFGTSFIRKTFGFPDSLEWIDDNILTECIDCDTLITTSETPKSFQKWFHVEERIEISNSTNSDIINCTIDVKLISTNLPRFICNIIQNQRLKSLELDLKKKSKYTRQELLNKIL